MPANRFALLLKRERLKRGWSQQQVADALQVSRLTVTRWERGAASPSLSMRVPLAELFGRQMEEIFSIGNAIGLPAVPSSNASMTVRTGNGISDDGQMNHDPGTGGIEAEDPFQMEELKHRLLSEPGEEVPGDGQDDPGMFAEEEARKIDLESRRLDLQMRRLEVQRKRVAFTVDTANQLITVLKPDCNADVRALVIESLLADLQLSDEESEQEVPLPTIQSVKRALEKIAKREKTRSKRLQKEHSPSPKESVLEEKPVTASPLGSTPLPDNPATFIERPQVEDSVSSFPDKPAIQTAILEKSFYNPYSRLTPVDVSEEFIGRTQLLRRLYSALANRQSISLVGPRLIGKSSVLRCLARPEMQARFGVDLSHTIFIHLDLREFLRKTSEEFFRDVTRRIIAQSSGVPGLPLQVEDRSEEAFSSILEQIVGRGFFPVLVFDAFDRVGHNKHFDPEFFAFLGAQVTMGKVAYVTASNASLTERNYRDIAGSPFFNIFHMYTLGPLEPEEARDLIRIPARKIGIEFSEEEIAEIIHLTGRHPFFIRRVCSILLEEKRLHIDNDKEIDWQHVRNQAYKELLPYFQTTWDHLPEHQRGLLQNEAQQKGKTQRELPELSESAFFRQFVRNTLQLELFTMRPEELQTALDEMDDLKALGETNLRLMKTVARRLSNNPTASAVERGAFIREVLNEAFERMRGPGMRTDGHPGWQLYSILFYRYFKYHMKNEQIAARLEFASIRQYYRYRNKAVEALLNILFEMEQNEANREE